MRVHEVQRPESGLSEAGEPDSHADVSAQVSNCALSVKRSLTSLLDQQTLTTLKAYPTTVDVCIIGNEEEKLQPAISHWRFKGVRICERDATPTDLDDHSLWTTTLQHHNAFEAAARRGAPHESSAKLMWRVKASFGVHGV